MTAKSGRLVCLSTLPSRRDCGYGDSIESLGDARAMRGYPCRGLHCIDDYRRLFRLKPLSQLSVLNGQPYSLRSYIALAMPNKGSRAPLGIPGLRPPLTISPLGRACLPTTPLAVGGHVSGSPLASCLGHDVAADASPGPRFAAPPKSKSKSRRSLMRVNGE